MRHLLALAVPLGLAACAASAPPPQPAATQSSPAVAVEVLRDGDRWTADFRFDRDAAAWAFTRSALALEDKRPWRTRSWTVETPGVRLDRRGRYDLLVAENGGAVPRRVRIRFTPFGRDLIADYDPALIFTDGSVAIHNEQFGAFPLASAADAETLPIDLNGVAAADVLTRVRFRHVGQQVLHRGRRYAGATVAGGGAYVLFGPAKPIVSDAMATVIDPQLPGWLKTALASSIPPILGSYADRLGPAPGGRPTFLVSWAGPTPGRTSMGGSVLPSTVVMRFEGAGVVAPNKEMAQSARQVIAHEGAHFWLGQAVRYQYSRDAWITEGGADLLAVRSVSALDHAYDARAGLQSLLDECLRLSAGRSVAGAEERNEHRAYYACGAMFALVAEAAERRASGGDFFSFLRRLIDANRADRVLTKDEWLTEPNRVSRDPSLGRDMRAMIETGVADPAAALASLFDRVGIANRREFASLLLQ